MFWNHSVLEGGVPRYSLTGLRLAVCALLWEQWRGVDLWLCRDAKHFKAGFQLAYKHFLLLSLIAILRKEYTSKL